jgi:hypothetical protein
MYPRHALKRHAALTTSTPDAPVMGGGIPSGAKGRAAPGPFGRVLNTVSSIWFGVALLVLIFAYCAVGSAVPPVRQGVLAEMTGWEWLRFEKSEMEWFTWWPFLTLIGMLLAACVLATVRRVPFNRFTAGTWITHLGILTLGVSAAVYFGAKTEGDVLIYHSRARIRLPGMEDWASLVIRPGASIRVGPPGQGYEIGVAHIDPGQESDADGGGLGRAPQIWLEVSTPSAGRFYRVMTVGHPEQTHDLMDAGGGMLPHDHGAEQRLLDPSLQVVIDYDEPARYFYHAHQPPVHSTGAIYARLAGEREWTQYRVRDLPHYHAYVATPDAVWNDGGNERLVVKALDLRARPVESTESLSGVHFRVTDYLPYAEEQTRWVRGGGRVSPLLRLRIGGPGSFETRDLLANAPMLRHVQLAEALEAQFDWGVPADQVEGVIQSRLPRLVVRVESAGIEERVPLSELAAPEGFELAGTDYEITLRQLIASGGVGESSPAAAWLAIRRGDLAFERVVLEGAEGVAQDFDGQGARLAGAADEDLVIRYENAGARLLLFAGPEEGGPVTTVFIDRNGRVARSAVAVGEAIGLVPGLPLAVDAVWRESHMVDRPSIPPRYQRRSLSEVGRSMSLMRVEVAAAGQTQQVWLPFNYYAWPDAQRAYPGRFPYRTREVQLADGRRLELLYSRWRDPLPEPIVLDRFILKTYPGGDRPSDFISLVRFDEGEGLSSLTEVKSNHPAENGGFWFFQSRWDPGVQSYTMLGVGNRVGVYPMLAGVCISIAGMAYAFYVKPYMGRRRKRERTDESRSPQAGAERLPEPEVVHA